MSQENLKADPIEQFIEIFEQAKAASHNDATAMVLSTCNSHGQPSGRVVLLKDVTPEGFIFYTNYLSRKARDMDDNRKIALTFHWPEIGVQVRIEGTITKTSPATSDRYFATRPRDSQLGAWASEQSEPLASRQALLDRVQKLDQQYADAPVPRPPNWGGYLVQPDAIEFWHNGDFRLHDRFLYTRLPSSEQWTIERLNP